MDPQRSGNRKRKDPPPGRSRRPSPLGVWYDGKRSAQIPARLQRDADGIVRILEAESGRPLAAGAFDTLKISPRLGTTATTLTFSDGGQFETDDSDGVDRALPGKRKNRIHLLESRKRYILLAVLLLGLMGWWSVRYGIPAAADWISLRLPETAYRYATEKTLEAMDGSLLAPSRLTDSRRLHVRESLAPAVSAHPDLDVRILFRHGGVLGANAFALPSGTVIFTDEMVRLMQDPKELQGILHHELGHVALRHGMRRLIQDSLLAFALVAIVGDASGVSELFLGLPVLLTEQAYSRRFEEEADAFALRQLQAGRICPDHYSAMLRRIERIQRGDTEEEETGRLEVLAGYLSTHPGTKNRLDPFDRTAREMGCSDGK